MALFLSFVPCVAMFIFAGAFLYGGHKFEAGKREREAHEDQMAASHDELVRGATAYLEVIEETIVLA
jgi:hypothetical protein